MQNSENDQTPLPKEISALQSNIKEKGTNSYYYAHKKRENVEIHAWDGNAAPRLLKTQSLASKPWQTTHTITTYAWADGKRQLFIYLKLPGIGVHNEEDLNVDWTATSLMVKIKNYKGQTSLFFMSDLYDEITNVKTRRKEDELVLQLVKAKELSWHSLKKDA
ncbi:hypothetical protein CCR75_004007 [Bremia lactucae]|uniref:CS domain-containing protein n=1 Tax=Bremia lactucae TaxID=4779 RepID=A0A976IJT1_BRELC|nr:hypothetical protein CCR75_004007 [Bremia lactucae]